MAETPVQAAALDALDPAALRALPEAELLQVHHRLHQLYGAARAAGRATEYPYVNLHVWVVEEFARRGLHHQAHDALDAETARLLAARAPAAAGGPAWVQAALATAEDAVLVPAYVSLVGSATAPDAAPHDVDVLVREDLDRVPTGWRESVLLLVRRLLDPHKAHGLAVHLLGNPQGPHLAPGQGYIPLYDLVLRPRRAVECVTKGASALPAWEQWLAQAPAGPRIDLGAGPEGPPPGFTALDRPVDLAQPWPLADGSVAVLRANHVFEHLPEPAHALTEAWRVLQPGGLLLVTVPEATSPGAVAHPEHRSLWNADSLRFWTDPQLLATVERRPPAPFEALHCAVRTEGPRRYVDAVLRKPAAAQVLDLARRARVLQEVPAAAAKRAATNPGPEPEPRDAAAQAHWEQHWQEAMPLSGRALPFVLHAHWRGLAAAEADRDLAALLETDHSLHFDLRLGTDRFDGWWGLTLFAGEAAANREQLRVFRLMQDADLRLASAPKQFGPAAWLRVGRDRPLRVPPGGVGSTSQAWSAFFAVDWGTWRLGMARQHAVELWLQGRHLRGRFLWQYAPLAAGQPRQWLFTRPADQRPYAATHSLEAVLQAVHAAGQRWLVWPRDPARLARGHRLLDVPQAVQGLRKYTILKAEPEQRYTLGVAYPAARVDAHGDYTTPAALEQAAWDFLARVQAGTATIGLMHQPGRGGAGRVVESYIYRGPEWRVGAQVVQPGDWLLGVIWTPAAWARIRRGEITGYSIQGWARRRPEPAP